MMTLAIDLFCGLGGWTEGLLAEGFEVIGFDIERHAYGEHQYPAQLVLQDVLTIHGSQFREASLIVASPPCQEYSYMAMPWSRAKQIAREYEDGTRDRAKLTALFDTCFRIQREACEAAGRHIPLVVENVRGACKWVGRSRWNYGSFHLWGDVPALMPMTSRRPAFKGGDRNIGRANGGHEWNTGFDVGVKVPSMGASWYPPDHPKHVPGLGFNTHADRATKNNGATVVPTANVARSAWKGNAFPHEIARGIKHGGDCFNDPSWPGKHGGTKQAGISGPRDNGKGDRWFQDGAARSGSKSSARKAASAMIAKIPLPLSRHIAATYRPQIGRPQ